MSISFETQNPKALLDKYKRLIDDKKVVTWSYDADGDFTHTPDQWNKRGWLRPSILNGRLMFGFLGTKREVTSLALYAVFQGRFIESMITHCADDFSVGSATARPTNSDQVITRVA